MMINVSIILTRDNGKCGDRGREQAPFHLATIVRPSWKGQRSRSSATGRLVMNCKADMRAG